jgi:hypothetical protein
MWTLIFCPSLFLGMCSQYSVVHFPDKETCYEALEIQLSRTSHKPAIIYCKPREGIVEKGKKK